MLAEAEVRVPVVTALLAVVLAVGLLRGLVFPLMLYLPR